MTKYGALITNLIRARAKKDGSTTTTIGKTKVSRTVSQSILDLEDGSERRHWRLINKAPFTIYNELLFMK